MNERLEAASSKTCHAKCDADVPIVLEVLITNLKYAANKATTLLGDYTDVFVLLCYYRQSMV